MASTAEDESLGDGVMHGYLMPVLAVVFGGYGCTRDGWVSNEGLKGKQDFPEFGGAGLFFSYADMVIKGGMS